MPSNIEICVLPESFMGTAGMRKTYWEQAQIPRFLRKKNVDVVHFPYPCNPWNGFEKPVCVTVHDTIPWESQAYRRSVTTRLYQDSCKSAVKKADHIFTVSETSKQDILRLTGVDEKKVSLSCNAPAPQFLADLGASASERLYAGATGKNTMNMTAGGGQAGESSRANAAEQATLKKNNTEILEKYGLDPQRRYFFYVGGYDERKNVMLLVDAFEKFIAPHFDIDLVLAGGKSLNDGLYASFDTAIRHQHSTRPGKILTTGFVEESDLPALYRPAFAFVSVSKQEGCNLPLLEALSSGIPVIASDIPVHHEMVREHALFVGVDDVEKLGAFMERLLRDGQFYESRLADAQNYRCPFSWKKTAESVYKVYEELLYLKGVL